MERISCTDDEDDLLELYAAVIQAVFNDRVENEEIERLDVADIIDTFGAIVEIIDICQRYKGTCEGRDKRRYGLRERHEPGSGYYGHDYPGNSRGK